MLYKPSEGMEGWFWRQLQTCGIKKADCRLVFMIDGPPANTGNKPSKAQLRDAKERFELEVRRSTPKVAIPMGTEAFFALTGINESILDARGYLIRKDLFHQRPYDVYKQVGTYVNNSKATGAKKGDPKMKWVREAQDGLLGGKFPGIVIPMFTIDYIRMEKFAVTPAFLEDLKRARRAVDGELIELTVDHMITEVKKLPPIKAWGDLVAIDIETHGIDNEVIDLVSFSDGDRTAVLEWGEDVRRYLDKMFKSKTRMWAVHNSPFDIPRLVKNGVVIPQSVIDRQIIDTMFGAVVVQPDLHKSLGRVAPVYLDLPPWKTSSRKETSHWRAMVNADPKRYAGKDAFYTYWIAVQLIAVMKQLGVWRLFTGTDGYPGPGVMETIPELTLMSQGGLRTSRAAADRLCERLEKKHFMYLKWWTKTFPNTVFSKNNQLMKLLYTEWGLPVYRTKEDGVPVDELALVKLRAYVRDHKDDPEVDAPWKDDPRCTVRTFRHMLKMRTTSKLLSTYVQPVILNTEKWVYPSYLPASKDDERGGKKMSSKGTTATGRLASYKPNIANQPKKMRVLYVPDEDDMCFIQADYKSAELYVLAGMSGDKLLLDDLQNDMHQRNADRLGVDRKTAKNVTYASQYLASPGKQSEMILEQEHMWVSPADCLNISEGIWGNYVDASAYKQLIVEMCSAKAYVQNKFGRIRFFHAGQAPQAVDFIPQSTVADILLCVLKKVAVFLRSLGGRLVTTVYDSMLACVPKDKVHEAAVGMKKIMEQRFDNVRKGFYIPVEVEVGAPGASWGSLKKYAI
jgi:hypothetical protein